jgi:restriction system protein
MARNKSLWSELQRERDRRARIALAREREERQLVRQLTQDRERAQRLALRATAAERKHQEQQAHEAGTCAARTLKSQLDRQINELQTLFTTRLDKPALLTFAMLRQVQEMPPFDPGYLADESPVPQWEDYAPRAPGALSGLLGGKGRYARASEAASEAFQRALAHHEQSEAERGRQLQEAQAHYDRLVHESEIAAREQNAAVDELERTFRAGAPEAVEEFFGQALALSEYPERFPRDFRVAYRPAPRELVIEYRLPPVTVIPVIRDYRYVKARRPDR